MDTKTVYAMVENEKKPTKAEAEDIVIRLAQTARDDTAKDIARLWRFFRTKPKAKAKKNVQSWVEQAVSTDDNRRTLQAAYSDGENIVATDGRRLHFMATDLEKGYYMDSQTVDDRGNYPNYKQVLPHKDVYEYDKVRMSKSELATQSHSYNTRFARDPKQLVKIGQALFNVKYLQEAMARDDTAIVWIPKDSGRPIQIDLSEDKYAVIMPTRIAEKDTTALK